MSEQPSVRNELIGNSKGPVVQAGKIDSVVFNPPPQGLPPGDLATYRRLLARADAKARAEDAAAQAAEAAAMEREQRISKARRRRWWYLFLFLLWWGTGAAGLWAVFPVEPPPEIVIPWTAVMGGIMVGWARTWHEARTGHPLPWLDLFLR
ncbi:hypothetical protein ACFU7T_25505 [Streptomyces sp. NPDC057555]|uniref:hypothetical protein n=1 Tax=Streptomyces sp. NPDC057555 TaxID=3346166 RepID=UPI00368414DA